MLEKLPTVPKKPKMRKRKRNKKKRKKKPVEELEVELNEDQLTSQKSSFATTQKTMLRETRSERLHRRSLQEEKGRTRLKKLFQSSMDPYDRPLEWWEQPAVKYA